MNCVYDSGTNMNLAIEPKWRKANQSTACIYLDHLQVRERQLAECFASGCCSVHPFLSSSDIGFSESYDHARRI